MRFMRHSVETTGLQIKPQGYITFVARGGAFDTPTHYYTSKVVLSDDEYPTEPKHSPVLSDPPLPSPVMPISIEV